MGSTCKTRRRSKTYFCFDGHDIFVAFYEGKIYPNFVVFVVDVVRSSKIKYVYFFDNFLVDIGTGGFSFVVEQGREGYRVRFSSLR